MIVERSFPRGIIVFCLAFILSVKTLNAGAGTCAGHILTQSAGARPGALAGAYTASSGVDAVHFNPAALAGIENMEISTQYQSGIAEDTGGAFDLAVPLENFALGINAVYYSAGNIELISETGKYSNVKAQQDIVIALSAARGLEYGIAAGAGLKILRSTLVEEFTAASYAADAGLRWEVLPDMFSAAVALNNIGTGLKYDTVKEKLPALLRGGIEYKPLAGGKNGITVTADMVKRFAGGNEKSVGIEYAASEKYFIRSGLSDNGDRRAPCFGFGAVLNNMRIDYAWIPDSEFVPSHKISFTLTGRKIEHTEKIKPRTKTGLMSLSEYFAESMEYYNAGDYKAAEKKFQKIINAVPGHKESHKYLNLCREKIYGEFPVAKKEKMAAKFIKKAEKLIEKKKYADAAEFLEKALILDPENNPAETKLKKVYEALSIAPD
ncbi:PorV/PorQ family protein [bacterium]|nr:PorV/PorQ family protein [bacterium]